MIDEADRMMDEIKHDWLMQVEWAVYQGAVNPNGEQRLSDETGNALRSAPGPITAAGYDVNYLVFLYIVCPVIILLMTFIHTRQSLPSFIPECSALLWEAYEGDH